MNYICWLVVFVGVCQSQVTTQCSATCGDSGCDDKTGNCNSCQPGCYGAKCDQDCGLCVRENCSSRACTLGCKAGYFQVFSEPGLSNCQSCISNCAICRNSSYCTMCNEGFYLSTYINQIRETQCIPCSTITPFCTSCYDQQNSIVCNRCSNGFALSQNECVVNNCAQVGCLNGCDSSGICYGCLDGRLGPKCDYLCNAACANCSTQTICEMCHDGFYSQECLQPCNSNCLSINNPTCNFESGKCSFGCNNGFWGDWCENKCSVNCKELAGEISVCFRNGTCALGCKERFEGDNCTQEISITTTLSFSNRVTTQCNIVGCNECNIGGGICNICSDGFWLELNNCSRCPDNCLTCTDNNYCQSCLPEYFGIDINKCKHLCSATCDNSGCDDKTGDCYACKAGYYGPKCDQDCGLCVTENCSSRACTLGCKTGYIQLFSEPDFSFCKPCISNCAFCSMGASCSKCNEGFYLKTYINSYGNVEVQCLPCSALIPFCTSCYYQQNDIVCNRCTNGYALSQNQCGENHCRNSVCLNGCDSSGICYGCVDGRTGQMCNYLCNTYYPCAQCRTQNICEKCHDSFYSPTCLQPCNSNCLSINNHTCNFEDGKCLYGCNYGYWGDWCQNKCSVNCKVFAGGLSLCFRNGSCALGYKKGFDEDTYTQTTSMTTTTSTSSVIKIKECESSPCENGATCIDKMHGFSCIYAPVYKENDRYTAAIGGLSAAVALLFVVLVVLAIHKLRSRSEGVPFKGFCCSCQNTKDQIETYATLKMQQPSESNEYDVMESTLSVNVGTEPETVQSQNSVEYINTTLEH